MKEKAEINDFTDERIDIIFDEFIQELELPNYKIDNKEKSIRVKSYAFLNTQNREG